MKLKKILIFTFVPILSTMNMLFSYQEIIIVPKEIDLILKKGLKSRQIRSEIPFEIFKHSYLLSAGIHFPWNIFYFGLKNNSSSAVKGEIYSNAFMQFYRIDNSLPTEIKRTILIGGESGELEKEIYIPTKLKPHLKDNGLFESEFYTFCAFLPPGKYLLAMAIASEDLKKVGTQYFEVSSPYIDPKSLEISSILFVKNISQLSEPERAAEIHKGFFTFSKFKIEPLIKNEFPLPNSLKVFYAISGAKSNSQGQYSIKTKYEIITATQKSTNYEFEYTSPLIFQKLSLFDKKNNLLKGIYTLVIEVTDNYTQKFSTQHVNFKIK